jgi:hypothetical protein
MPKHRAPFVILSVLFVNTCAYAEVPDPSSERTTWDHNGSVMYLIANGSSRELFYEKPRPGMVEAGAKTGSLLFRGEVSNGQYIGTTYMFNLQCGQVPFQVKGGILDDGKRIVLTGLAPRIGRNCRAIASYSTTLEFRLLNPIADSPASEPQKAEEPKAEVPLMADNTLNTPSPPATAPAPSPPKANDVALPAKQVTANMARLPLGTPLPQHAEKDKIAGGDFENYVSTGSVIVVTGALLFLSARQISRKLFWRNKGLY